MKTKIIVAGIGGVGGWFGGLLASAFSESDKVEVDFLARGEHLRQIQQRGLKMLQGEHERIAKPRLATDNATEIGICDYILVCTKSYDLEQVMMQVRPCIDQHTILIPFLN